MESPPHGSAPYSHWRVALPALVLVVTVGVPASARAAGPAHYRTSHHEALNDLSVTPGATFAVGRSQICRSGYASSVRDVPESEKNAVYAEYGITHRVAGQYEIDHLISLELGGSNVEANLWPEPNDHPPGYLNSKDILENRLHDLVCAHQVGLRAAQRAIATNWVREFHVVLGYWPSRAATTTTLYRPSGGPHGVRVTRVTGTVPAGGLATVVAKSARPRDLCTLRVTLPSGHVSTASGTGPASANARGLVRWTWRITANTGAGTAHLAVHCTAGRATSTLRIGAA